MMRSAIRSPQGGTDQLRREVEAVEDAVERSGERVGKGPRFPGGGRVHPGAARSP